MRLFGKMLQNATNVACKNEVSFCSANFLLIHDDLNEGLLALIVDLARGLNFLWKYGDNIQQFCD